METLETLIDKYHESTHEQLTHIMEVARARGITMSIVSVPIDLKEAGNIIAFIEQELDIGY